MVLAECSRRAGGAEYETSCSHCFYKWAFHTCPCFIRELSASAAHRLPNGDVGRSCECLLWACGMCEGCACVGVGVLVCKCVADVFFCSVVFFSFTILWQANWEHNLGRVGKNVKRGYIQQLCTSRVLYVGVVLYAFFFFYILSCLPKWLHLIIPTVVCLCSLTCKINVSSFHLLYLQRSSVYEVKYLSGGARHAPLFSGEHFLSHLFHSFHLPRLSLSFSICHSFSCLIGRSILCFTW